ncbi:gamma-glutamyltransferase [Candidatus Palauibacter sp.]|uniref:gamma-glutamyltransferase n=1 Tax=Candidatus Palauibacter sp. TaxID=3101350 RepID=UPI003B01B2FE
MKTDGTDLRPADARSAGRQPDPSRRAFLATAAAGVGAVATGSLGACGPGEEAAVLASSTRAPGAGGGIVVARGPIAVEAGVGALRRGGNAIDAAVATAFAQFITTPFSAGVGGFGCMVVYDARGRRAVSIDFHGRAGGKATPDIYRSALEGRIYGHADRWKVRGDINQIGYRSVVTPGTIAGLWEAWSRFGTRPWAELVEPAIRLAYDGFEIPRALAGGFTTRTESSSGVVPFFTKVRTTDASARIFLNNGVPWRAGELLVQRDYARTLELIAEGGADVVYRGEIAERIAADFEKNEGLVTLADLEAYTADVYDPVRGTYRGHEVLSNALPGSGAQVIEILNLLEGYDLPSLEHGRADHVELLGRAQILSFIDRRRYHGDPRFIDDPTDILVSKDRAAELRAFIDRRELPPDVVEEPPEGPDTTHLSTADREGNCVALTHTLGSASGVVTEGLGFTWNNCMFQFNPVAGRPNSIAPGKARITGISPAIVLRDGQPILVTGAAGGTRILGAVQHTISNTVDFDMSALEAVSAPRWHWEDQLLEMEPQLYHHLKEELEGRGLDVANDAFVAQLHAVGIDPDTGRLTGGPDPRGWGGGSATV